MSETRDPVVELREVIVEIDRQARTGVDAGDPLCNRLIRRLAGVVADLQDQLADRLPPIEEQRMHVAAHSDLEERLATLEIGGDGEATCLEIGREYDLTLRVRATVVERRDGHGLCFKLHLDQRDYVEPRVVDVDADEIRSASPR